VIDWHKATTPNEAVPVTTAKALVAGWVALWLAYWTLMRPMVFPSPLDVLGAFPGLWWQEGLADALASSLRVSVEAIVLSAAIALPLAYVSRIPAVRPLAAGLSTLRFLSPAVFFMLLLFMIGNGHGVKLGMLVGGQAFFLLTTMVSVVHAIPDDAFDDARTLRMSEWTATWYVVVRGTLPQAFDAIRDNAAIAWGMLMMVEGVIRSEGGLGVLMLQQERYFRLADIGAIALTILAVGLVQDWAIGWLKRAACPWVTR
jgi:NitT/TauT family transport system permease protein